MINRNLAIKIFYFSILTLTFIPNDNAIGQTKDSTILIEVGLSTDRSNTEGSDGAFSAEILAKNGITAAIYNCYNKVEKISEKWAKNNNVRLLEKIIENEHLHLVYISKKPAGNFVLDYKVSRNPDKVKITFWFRTLSNVKLSGDQIGLGSLGEQLLQAIQCVP